MNENVVQAGEGASPSPSIPMRPVGQATQKFDQMEEWFQHFKDLADRYEARSFLRYQKTESEWFKRYEEQSREILEKSVEIVGLIVSVLHEKTERMKLERRFNLWGALELIVCHARLIKKIGTKGGSGIQAGIDELAKIPEFVAALQDEIASCQIDLNDVTACIGCIYSTASKHAVGNDSIITIYEDRYTKEECAVLAALFRVQRGWPNGFGWAKLKGGRKTRR